MPSVSRSKLTWIRVESGIRKRAHDDDSTVYAVRVRRKGTPERTLTCPTLRDARKQRDIAGSQAWEGKHTQGAEGRQKTITELCEAFLKAPFGDRTDRSRTHKGHSSGGVSESTNIVWYKSPRITPQSLILYREELLKSVTPTTCSGTSPPCPGLRLGHDG